MPKIRRSTVLVLEGDDDAVAAVLAWIIDMARLVNVGVTESPEGPQGNDHPT
jgi:hypothetical protein